jgi:hypothetical protein
MPPEPWCDTISYAPNLDPIVSDVALSWIAKAYPLASRATCTVETHDPTLVQIHRQRDHCKSRNTNEADDRAARSVQVKRCTKRTIFCARATSRMRTHRAFAHATSRWRLIATRGDLPRHLLGAEVTLGQLGSLEF